MEREIRSMVGPAEVRDDATAPRLSGYAAVFNQRANIAGLFDEEILPGAFTAAIGRDDVRALFNHDGNFVLGRSSSGTLRLVQDDHGLRYEVDAPDTTWARDLLVTVRRGDVSQSSFAFGVDEEEWDYSNRAMPLRKIKAVRLYDVSPVTYPAYDGTEVSARCRDLAAAGATVPGVASVEIAQSRERCRLAEAEAR
jgi:HK97 family phage prohead protease